MYIFMVDIDETLLTNKDRLKDIVVPWEISQFNPYSIFGATESCYTLNKENMSKIFESIVGRGYKIGFITAGSINREGIKKFIKIEFGVDLPHDFIHCNSGTVNKACIIKLIAEEYRCHYKNVFFIDNDLGHCHNVKDKGFSVIHADTQRQFVSPDYPPGSYITELQTLLAHLEKQPDESEPFIPAPVPKISKIIIHHQEIKPEAAENKLAEMKRIAAERQRHGLFSRVNLARLKPSTSAITKCLTACFKRLN